MTVDLSSGHMIPVQCSNCEWDNDGTLHAVDRYASDHPPGPRGRGDWTETYSDRVADPDDRVLECGYCGQMLTTPDDLAPRSPR